jgi:hypothetical protein
MTEKEITDMFKSLFYSGLCYEQLGVIPNCKVQQQQQ